MGLFLLKFVLLLAKHLFIEFAHSAADTVRCPTVQFLDQIIVRHYRVVQASSRLIRSIKEALKSMSYKESFLRTPYPEPGTKASSSLCSRY